MRDLDEHDITDAVLARMAGAPDPRLREVLGALIRHLHAFAREVELTPAEWERGIRFLTDTGHACVSDRQEFILLSDTLGLSILVDAMANRKPTGATASSVLGPFHRDGAPELAAGETIARQAEGTPAVVAGRVLDAAGTPIVGAILDVWQTNGNGLYETQDPDQPDMNLRGRFRTDAEGRFRFRTVEPVSYPIPHDGPVGSLLRSLGRHPFRPAHIHFIVVADGFDTLVTQVFSAGDPYLGSDAVFGVKDNLVAAFRRIDDPDVAARYRTPAPFGLLEYDFTLSGGGSG